MISVSNNGDFFRDIKAEMRNFVLSFMLSIYCQKCIYAFNMLLVYPVYDRPTELYFESLAELLFENNETVTIIAPEFQTWTREGMWQMTLPPPTNVEEKYPNILNMDATELAEFETALIDEAATRLKLLAKSNFALVTRYDAVIVPLKHRRALVPLVKYIRNAVFITVSVDGFESLSSGLTSGNYQHPFWPSFFLDVHSIEAIPLLKNIRIMDYFRRLRLFKIR